MPLSPTAIAALAEEQSAQQARLKALDEERADALRTIAAIDQLLTKSQPARQVPEQNNLLAPAAWSPTEVVVVVPGLRDILRAVLSGGAKSPRDVVSAVRLSGFRAQGKTPIDTRVYNELGRMKRDGLAVKQDDGRYALAS